MGMAEESRNGRVSVHYYAPLDSDPVIFLGLDVSTPHKDEKPIDCLKRSLSIAEETFGSKPAFVAFFDGKWLGRRNIYGEEVLVK